MSEIVCGLPPREVERVIALVTACGLPTAPPKITHERWLELMGHDKKMSDGVLRFVLLETLGGAVIKSGIGREQWEAAQRA